MCEHNPKAIERKKLMSNKHKGILKVKRLTIKKNCLKCNKEFEETGTENHFKNGKVRKYCSAKCANTHILTDATKLKISEAVKNSETYQINNKIALKHRIENNNLKLGIVSRNEKNEPLFEFTCLHCNKNGFKNRRDGIYHLECWLKISGGLKPGTSRGKHGWYKGYRCDSSYELAFVIYNLEHNIKFERNKKGFEYQYENKKHLFYPDFIIGDKYVEIKNFRSEITDTKINAFPHTINVIYKDTIKPYLDYVIDKYGKDFIKLYEKE